MKLNQLRDMLAIVERGSLRAAARHLDLAQPALTRSIRSLEKDLGTTLFEREAKGMVLTAAGQLFYQRAKQVLNDLRRAKEEIEQSQGALSGTVVMGLSIMPHLGLLPKALPKFRERFSQVKIKVIEGLYPAIESGLREGQIDFYLGASPEEGVAPGLRSESVFKNTRTVIARRGHPLIHAKHLHELSQAEWATTSVSLDAENDLLELFHKYKLPQPKVMFQASSALSVMIALTHSDLIALLPVQWNDFHLTKNALEVIELKEVLPAPDIVLVTRSGLPLTPAAEYFCDLLRRELSSTASTTFIQTAKLVDPYSTNSI